MLRTSYCFKGRTNERHNICKLSQCNCGNHPRQPEDIGGQPHRFISCSLIHMKTLRKRWIDSHPSFFCILTWRHHPSYSTLIIIHLITPGFIHFPTSSSKLKKKRNQWRYSDKVRRQSDVENFIWEWLSRRHDSEPKEKSNYLVLPGAVQN